MVQKNPTQLLVMDYQPVPLVFYVHGQTSYIFSIFETTLGTIDKFVIKKIINKIRWQYECDRQDIKVFF